jgi:hypothetical protein
MAPPPGATPAPADEDPVEVEQAGADQAPTQEEGRAEGCRNPAWTRRVRVGPSPLGLSTLSPR